ncbi:MAG: (2Fe-2S) ferredoxin domain-containing protein [Leptospirales bacterium]|nr:(2Fe-2S) ferredoxin domain-containing protein [Leptospirales bacterium]
MYYDAHIFFCENVREEGARVSCGRQRSAELRNLLKRRVKENGLKMRIRINSSGCLDRCEEGPVQVAYPEGRWFRLRSAEDVERFLQDYLQRGDLQALNDLRLPDHPPEDGASSVAVAQSEK